jgi:hypothetical protein
MNIPMPIEIRELVIKATVDQSQGSASGASMPVKGSSSNSSAGEDIIKECVDKVLAILKERNER